MRAAHSKAKLAFAAELDVARSAAAEDSLQKVEQLRIYSCTLCVQQAGLAGISSLAQAAPVYVSAHAMLSLVS